MIDISKYPAKDYSMDMELTPRHFTEEELLEAESRCTYMSVGWHGEKHPMYGRTHTKASRKLISENHADVNGENNPMYGRGEIIKKAWAEGRYDHVIQTGRPKGAKDLKPRKQRTQQKIIHGDRVYENAYVAAEVYAIHPANIRRKCREEKFTDWRYG